MVLHCESQATGQPLTLLSNAAAAALMKTDIVTITFSPLTSHLTSEGEVSELDFNHQQPSRQSAVHPFEARLFPFMPRLSFVLQPTVSAVTPRTDQVRPVASGVRPAGSIKPYPVT